METKTTKKTYRKRYQIKNLQDLKTLIEYLEGRYVKRFYLDGIEIEFDTQIAAIHKAEESQVTSAVQQAKDSKTGMLDQPDLGSEISDLFWSSSK